MHCACLCWLHAQTPVSEADASIPPKARCNDYVEDFHTLKPAPDKTMQDVTCKEEKEDLNPYARLGELEALDLISFAYQIAMGMVSYNLVCFSHPPLSGVVQQNP